ncbi:hypothetical protein C7974DRAFT_374242 [Boeremia exigua]|uniref:uncharacterized protein n=1 Tax=Boeremia exigua TaxID=749465 RepID=UPI001E8EA045|nr:uncharacterized protein C7974DRAFT_374242 [Boeremia exigua]KAH6637559.1 hypothetical protein C7974DRAFT_374242 [Boeremia exigua]
MACCDVPCAQLLGPSTSTSRDNVLRGARAKCLTRAGCIALSGQGRERRAAASGKRIELKWLMGAAQVSMHEQGGAANTANLRRPSKGARPLDVAVETAEVRGSVLRSLLGGPVENITRPATVVVRRVAIATRIASTDSTARLSRLGRASNGRSFPPPRSSSAGTALRSVLVSTYSAWQLVTHGTDGHLMIGYTAASATEDVRKSSRNLPSDRQRPQSSTPKIVASPQ